MSRTLRVAIDIRPLSFESVGGVGLFVAQLLEELGTRGVEFIGIGRGPLPDGRVDPAVPLVLEEAPGGRIRWEARALPRALRTIAPPPDLYHATWNHGVPPGLPFPSVLTVHDLIPWVLPGAVPWPKPAPLHQWLYRRALRASCRTATLVTTDSEASRRDLERHVPEVSSRLTVVPLALPRWFRSAGASEAAALRERLGTGRPYWLYLGGFDPRKGIPFLLQAMALAFPDRSRAPELLLAGGRNAESRAIEAEARALRLPVRFPGYLADTDLPALFAGASLFLYPSRYEGFGIPLLFAMASGVPTVASDAGSIPEVLGDAGVLFPAGDVETLAAILRRAREDPSFLSQAAARGPSRTRRFTLEALADGMLRVYERAVSRRGEST